MQQHNNNPYSFSHKRQCKDNNNEAKIIKLFIAPKCKTSTMLVGSIETCVFRASNHSSIVICRLRSEIYLLKKLAYIKLKHLSGCYSTDINGFSQLLKTYILWK